MEPLISKKRMVSLYEDKDGHDFLPTPIFYCMGTAWFHYIEASKTLFFLLLTVDYKNGSYRGMP